MVTLHFPELGDVYYCIRAGVLFGPMSATGTSNVTEISWRPESDFLVEETPPHFGEKDVSHHQLLGDIYYDEAFLQMVRVPSLNYPEEVRITALNLAGVKQTFTAQRGVSPVGDLHMFKALSHTVISYDSQGWHLYEVYAKTSSPSKLTHLNETIMTNFRVLGTLMYCDLVLIGRYVSAGIETYIDWTVPQTIGSVQSQISKFPITSRSVQNKVQMSSFRINGRGAPDVSGLMRILNASVGIPSYEGDFPAQAVHYGDLAMQASAGAVSNPVNMIAFVRDLRNPVELLPKLKNMRKLKTLAENYLTMSYGILPTVSDLQNIVDALKKRIPYLDRNGFATYRASHFASFQQDTYSYLLEQHIKIAVGNEDNGLIGLVQKLESSGWLPTFENIWDLIPYSFVVDWFVDVGDYLERVDAINRIYRLPIKYSTLSRKTTIQRVISGLEYPYRGIIRSVDYHRWVPDHCPLPPLSLQQTDGFDHWLESGALILART